MNVSFILVLSLIIQLLLRLIVKLVLSSALSIPIVYYIELIIVSTLSIFLPAYLYLKDKNREYFTDCFSGVKPNMLMAVCLLIGLFGQYASILVNIPSVLLVKKFGGVITSYNLPVNSFGMFLMAIFSVCVLPAVFEEVMFRGVVFNYFRQYGKKAAILISSFLFALMHCDFTNFFATFLIGAICAYTVSKTNRIVYSMIIHFMVNFVSLSSSYILKSNVLTDLYNDWLPALFIVAIPLIIYLLTVVRDRAEYLPYKDMEKYEKKVESVVKINEESSIKIIEHSVKENNLPMALSKLFSTVYVYIIIALFIYLGGSNLW